MKRRTAPLPLPAPELSLYRGHCIALLRRYFCMSVEVGRLPSILGRECFTTRTEDYHAHSFEDTVLFVIDVERCLDRLYLFDKELIACIILQEYAEDEAMKILHCSLRTIERRLPGALDFLTDTFLQNGMLNITEKVGRNLAENECEPLRRHRVPQRATANHRSHSARSHLDTLLVKPPFSANSPQAAAVKENIILSDVAGLPSESAILSVQIEIEAIIQARRHNDAPFSFHVEAQDKLGDKRPSG